MTQRKMHRRRFLQLSGATTAAVVLAACGGPEPEVITEEPAAAPAAEEEAPRTDRNGRRRSALPVLGITALGRNGRQW